MRLETIHPDGWKPARGYANAIRVEGARAFVFVAGQIAWDEEQRLVGRGDFAAQFARALRNVVACLRASGASPEHLVRVTIYVTDKQLYLAATRAIGAAWKEIMGAHYPAMALVEVAGLLEDGALVEIEATAAVP